MALQEESDSVQSLDSSEKVEVDGEAFERESEQTERKPSDEATNDTVELTCTQCGDEAFVSGVVSGEYDSGFQPDDGSWMNKLFSTGWSIDAYACRSCGTIIERVTDLPDDESSS